MTDQEHVTADTIVVRPGSDGTVVLTVAGREPVTLDRDAAMMLAGYLIATSHGRHDDHHVDAATQLTVPLVAEHKTDAAVVAPHPSPRPPKHPAAPAPKPAPEPAVEDERPVVYSTSDVASFREPVKVEFTFRVIEIMREHDISEADVEEVVNNPISTREAPGGNGTCFYGEHIGVITPDDAPQRVVSVFPIRSETGYGYGRPKSGGSGKSVPSTYREMADRLREHGFQIDETRRHPQITHPDHPEVYGTIPRTPSDSRSYRNNVVQIRHNFGIDITK